MLPTASSPAVASRMSRQASRDTAQELAVRRLLYGHGLRYRVNRRVPGMARRTVDITFIGPKVAVFLDGCFWHGCPEHATSPKANAEWWRTKLDRNIARDRETSEHLTAEGWTVLRFWEHEDPDHVAEQVEQMVRRLTCRSKYPQLNRRQLRRTSAFPGGVDRRAQRIGAISHARASESGGVL